MAEPRYLGTKEAAAYLGVAAKTLEKLRVTGKGPPYAKAGRRVIYDRRDLDKWVAKRKRRFTGESVEEDDARPGDEDESVEEDRADPGDGGDSGDECGVENEAGSAGDSRSREEMGDSDDECRLGKAAESEDDSRREE